MKHRHEVIKRLASLEEPQRLFLQQLRREIHDEKKFVFVEGVLLFLRGREGVLPGLEASFVPPASVEDVSLSNGAVDDDRVPAMTVVQGRPQAAAAPQDRDPLRLLARARLLLGTSDGRGDRGGRGGCEVRRVGEGQERHVVRIVLDYFRFRHGYQHHQRYHHQGYQPHQARLSHNREKTKQKTSEIIILCLSYILLGYDNEI